MAHPKIINIALSLFSVLFSPIYAQQWHTTLELTHPAEISLPDSVMEVLIVNNSVAHPDLPQGVFYTLMAASEMLESPTLHPSVLEISQNTSGSLYRRRLLDDNHADSLLTDYGVQALIILNQHIVHVSEEAYWTDNDTYYALITGIVACHWSLVQRTKNTSSSSETRSTAALSSQSFISTDTLYWESEGNTIEEVLASQPTTESAQAELCVHAGEMLAQRFLPTTEQVDRYLYTVQKDDPGMESFVRQRWQEAIDYWLTPRTDVRTAARAAANCAVAYEILGDLKNAYSLAARAHELFASLHRADDRQQAANMQYYQGLLLKRMAE